MTAFDDRKTPGARWRRRTPGLTGCIAAALALLLLHSTWAAAFVLIDSPFRKWLTPDIPAGGVRFVIDDRGESSVTVADGSSDQGLTQVIAAVQLWN